MHKIVDRNKEYGRVLGLEFMRDFVVGYKAGVERALAGTKLPVSVEEMLAIYAEERLRFTSIEAGH